MRNQQIIIIFTSAGAIIAFLVSFAKIAKALKILLRALVIACIVVSSVFNWSYIEKKETKEVAFEKKIEQLDTHLKASMTFEDYIQAARLNRKEGKIVEAIQDAERALEEVPNSETVLNLLGVLYTDKGDYDKAIEAFEKIKKGFADSSIVKTSGEYLYHRNFAEAYIAKNMWKEAKEEFLKCLSLNEKDMHCYIGLANSLEKLNDWKGLYDLCKKGIILFPNSALLHNFLGKACIFMFKLDEAEVAFQDAIHADSTFEQPYLLLALIYFLRKEPEKSERFLAEALRVNPASAKEVEELRSKFKKEVK
jgi:tetratricopeptide (TPR) repeat protein